MDEREERLETRRRETQHLTQRALKLGFKIPREPGWWFEDEDFYGGKTLEEIELLGSEYLLTDDGIAGANGLIKVKMREIWESRIRIMAALTGILGALIGVLAIILRR